MRNSTETSKATHTTKHSAHARSAHVPTQPRASHSRSRSCVVLSMNTRAASAPNCRVTTVGSTPLCLLLLIFSHPHSSTVSGTDDDDEEEEEEEGEEGDGGE